MLGKPTQDQNQLSLFGTNLIQIINLDHPLVLLSTMIPWQEMEKQFKDLYAKVGNPSHPIRKMAGLLLLQNIYKLSDERVVAEWEQNVYYQFFTGEASLQWGQPCAASDLVHFRKRISKQGVEYLFKLCVSMHGKKIKKEREVMVDTTVPEKNITFPTDAKLYKKIIDTVNKIAKKVGIKLRQSYVRVSKKLMYAQRYLSTAKHNKKARKALNKLRTIASRQIRELTRCVAQLGKEETYSELLKQMEWVLKQKRESKNKIYSLHETEVSCIAKGKTGKKYEFGSKVSIASLGESGVIVGIESYKGNPHDSTTLNTTMEMVQQVTGKQYERVLVDRGYRGAKLPAGSKSELIIPGKKGMVKTSYTYLKYKKSCKKRAGIEGRISHLKTSHKLGRNYLKGALGDIMNGLLSGIGYNLHLLLIEIGIMLKEGIIFLFIIVKGVIEERLLGSQGAKVIYLPSYQPTFKSYLNC